MTPRVQLERDGAVAVTVIDNLPINAGSAEVRRGLLDGHLQPDRKGDPELPLSDAELGAKLLELAGPVIGDAPARALLQRLWTLDTSETLP
jgi:hypothetical protein